jgi:hypothetical protein
MKATLFAVALFSTRVSTRADFELPEGADVAITNVKMNKELPPPFENSTLPLPPPGDLLPEPTPFEGTGFDPASWGPMNDTLLNEFGIDGEAQMNITAMAEVLNTTGPAASGEDWCLDWYPENYINDTCESVYGDYVMMVDNYENFTRLLDETEVPAVPEDNVTIDFVDPVPVDFDNSTSGVIGGNAWGPIDEYVLEQFGLNYED